MKYHRLYKYQLDEPVEFETPVRGYEVSVPSGDGERPWLRLSFDGKLSVREGYSWDGASGPTIDTRDSMRASLAHDAFYQLMSLGKIPTKRRKLVDVTFRHLLRDAGMPFVRRNIWYVAVRMFGWLFLLSASESPDKAATKAD